ncbi:hypothetical protein IID19_05635 [Patescibacteria group bacterium]|nr:hypothetical protein [Patescibacteria group bacterium]
MSKTIKLDDLRWFEIRTRGITGRQFIKENLDRTKGFCAGTIDLLESEHFIPTRGNYLMTIILGRKLYMPEDRRGYSIRLRAEQQGLIAPSLEVAAHVFEIFSHKKYKDTNIFPLVMMMDPIPAIEPSCPLAFDPWVLVMESNFFMRVRAYSDDKVWDEKYNFVFLASQIRRNSHACITRN